MKYHAFWEKNMEQNTVLKNLRRYIRHVTPLAGDMRQYMFICTALIHYANAHINPSECP